MKKKKKKKNSGGNIWKYGWEYSRWKFFRGYSPGGSLVGGNFPGRSLTDIEETICQEFSSVHTLTTLMIKLKLKFWKSFNQKNVYLLQKMQIILKFKTLNSRKQIFCPKSERATLVKINQHKILRKSNFILLSIAFI